MSMRRAMGAPSALVVLGGILVLAGCRDILTEPAPAGPASLALAVVMPEGQAVAAGAAVVAGAEGSVASGMGSDAREGITTQSGVAAQTGPAASPGAAFDQADRIRIQLLGSRGTRIEVDRAFRSEGAVTRVRIEADVDEEEAVVIALELRFQGALVFEAEGTARLVPGEASEAELTLSPVVDALEVSSDPVVLDALTARVTLYGQGVFATGHPVPGALPDWESRNPQVARIVGGNQVEAVSPGETEIVARLGEREAVVPVQVNQRVASVQVTPEALELGVGGQGSLAASLADANGFPVDPSGRNVQWSSSASAVAGVDATGRVTAVGPGTATITAAVDGASGSAAVTVLEGEPPPPEDDLPGGWVAFTWNGDDLPVLGEQDEECSYWIEGFGMDLAGDGTFRMRIDQREDCPDESVIFTTDYRGQWTEPSSGALRLTFTFGRFFLDGELWFETEVDFVEFWGFRFQGDVLVVDAVDTEEGETYIIEMRRGEVVFPAIEGAPARSVPEAGGDYNLNSLKSLFSSGTIQERLELQVGFEAAAGELPSVGVPRRRGRSCSIAALRTRNRSFSSGLDWETIDS